MKKLVINVRSGAQEYLDMTSEEEAQRLAEIIKAEEEATRIEEIEQGKRDAIERLKASVNEDTIDLLKALNL
jgi:regulator of protease activity HflC (stomatin/prohibitin superfamily)